MNKEILPDLEALSKRAAEIFLHAGKMAIAERGRYTVMLSGGETPKRSYEWLRKPELTAGFDWSAVHFFWGDERCVPPADPRSNFGFANEHLLRHLPITPSQVHRIHGELEVHSAVEGYANDLHEFFGKLPRFDLIFLGVGDDGHTASLFPLAPLPNDPKVWVVPARRANESISRVSVTPEVLNGAAEVIFLVSGAAKSEMVKTVATGHRDVNRFPAQVVQPTAGTLTWVLDQAAAAALSPR